MRNKLLSLLLVLCMVLGMLPVSVFAAGNAVPVKKEDISISMRLNAWVELDLSEYFTDADNDRMTYFVSDDGVVWNELPSAEYRYYPAGTGVQTAYFKAVDTAENESEPLKLTATVATPPSTVTVTLSVTKGVDKFYQAESTNKMLFAQELTVPYFDLANYDLEHYYYNPRCYSTHTENDTEESNNQLVGTKDTAEGIVTLMHVFIYATEVLYLGYPESDAGTGLSYTENNFQDAISWTGSVGSSFMNLWDHGTNLNYYIDWGYPLGAPGWGSTSDQQALYGGEDISIHMIKSSSATGSNFAFFTADGTYQAASQVDMVDVTRGQSVTLTVAESQSDWDRYTTENRAYNNQQVFWCHEDNLSSDLKAAMPDGKMLWSDANFGGHEKLKTNSEGRITINTANIQPGIYYLSAIGTVGNGGSTETGPAIVALNVVCGHEWNDATCTKPKTCTVCHLTEGRELKHRWTAATCSAPQTCSVCKITEGETDLDAHNIVAGVCTLCQTPLVDNTTAAPVLTGSATASTLEAQHALYELDLATVFTDGISYTVSVDGGEAVATNRKYSYSCPTSGNHTLVFTASNKNGSSSTYTVNMLVIDANAVQEVKHQVQGGTVEWIAFTDTQGNPLPEGTTYKWKRNNNKYYRFTVTQPVGIDLSGKVVAYYKLVKDTPGAKLPLLTGSTTTTGAGSWWDGAVRDRQTITLYNGQAKDKVFLYETAATNTNNDYTTIEFNLDRVEPETYFEYETDGYHRYTIAGYKGGVNGHSWLTSDEVHIALKDTTPKDAQLLFLNQEAATNLVNGESTFTWTSGTKKTIKYKIDQFPHLATKQIAPLVANVPAGTEYTIDLADLFVDPDEGDTLTYRVKVDGGNMTKCTDSTYTYKPENVGEHTLEFFAYDNFVYSQDSYTVKVTAVNMAKTYDVTVKNLPSNAKFYYNNGFSSNGAVLLGGELAAEYADGTWTVKVPGNISCIVIEADGCRISADVSETAKTVTMQKTTFQVKTAAGDPAEGTVSVTYGKNYKAVGKNNTFWLVSGSGYLFEALPSSDYSARWYRGGKSGAITTDPQATIAVPLTVNNPKVITIDKGADLTVFYQWGYYRMYPVEPALVKDNGSTITYTYPCPETQAYAKGYMYFATNGDLIDKAGYMNAVDETTITWVGETRKNDHIGTNDRYTYMNERTDDSVMVNVNPQNHLVLDPGDTFRLRAFRIWEIINTDTKNVMIEPQSIYSGYDQNLITLTSANVALAAEGKNQVNGTGGNNWMDMKVKGSGTTFMEVSYEAIHIIDGFEAGDWGGAGGQPGNYLFSACDPARTSLIVIQTDGNAATDVKFGIQCLSSYVGEENFYTGTGLKEWDVEFDTLYFLGDKGEMKLSPSVTSGAIASVAVSADKGVNWTTLTAENGVYTADIYSGNNVIRVTKADGKTAYQVVRGDQITYTQTITNDLNKNGEVDPGDTVKLQFHGLHNPVGKMSGIYNPGYSHGQRVAYTWNGEQVRQSSYHQYSFVKNAELSVTVPADAVGRYALTDGYIHFNVFGDMPGTHRDLTEAGRPVNTTAESGKHTRSLLPEIVIYEDYSAHQIILDETVTRGTLSADRNTAEAGALVTLTAQPDEGCRLISLTVTDSSGEPVEVQNGQFTMPGSDVTVTAVFAVEGDVTGDGKLTTMDVLRCYGLMKSQKALSAAESAMVDTNGNGKIEAMEILKLYGLMKKSTK